MKQKYNRILYLDDSETIYTSAIKTELQNFSNTLDCFFYDEIYRSPIFLNRINPKRDTQQKETRIKEFLDYLKKYKYDFILVKAPFLMPIHFFQELKNMNLNAPFVNYNWSSINKFNFLPYRDLFTKIYSFDYNDSKLNDINYYPLFFRKEFGDLNRNNKSVRYLLSFIGSGYSPGRLSFLNNLVKKEIANIDRFFLYIHTPQITRSLKVYLKYRLLRKYCFWHQLSLNGVLNIMSQSNAAIDHPMTIQTGLTIRTFEALAAGLHLYTTNNNIFNEPFYSEDRITVIKDDLSNLNLKDCRPKDDESFFTSFQEYRIDNWVKHILQV